MHLATNIHELSRKFNDLQQYAVGEKKKGYNLFILFVFIRG